MIISEKTSTYSMLEINMERFGRSCFSVTHPHDDYFYDVVNIKVIVLPLNRENINPKFFYPGS
ncbi:MAG: hypothetical protein AB9861_16815 [Methanosarcina sp.]